MDNDAARRAAREIAAKIVHGEIDAEEGAMRIWKDIVDVMTNPVPDDLWAFKSNASALEDCRADTADFGSDHSTLIAQLRHAVMEAARAIA